MHFKLKPRCPNTFYRHLCFICKRRPEPRPNCTECKLMQPLGLPYRMYIDFIQIQMKKYDVIRVCTTCLNNPKGRGDYGSRAYYLCEMCTEIITEQYDEKHDRESITIYICPECLEEAQKHPDEEKDLNDICLCHLCTLKVQKCVQRFD